MRSLVSIDILQLCFHHLIRKVSSLAMSFEYKAGVCILGCKARSDVMYGTS